MLCAQPGREDVSLPSRGTTHSHALACLCPLWRARARTNKVSAAVPGRRSSCWWCLRQRAVGMHIVESASSGARRTASCIAPSCLHAPDVVAAARTEVDLLPRLVELENAGIRRARGSCDPRRGVCRVRRGEVEVGAGGGEQREDGRGEDEGGGGGSGGGDGGGAECEREEEGDAQRDQCRVAEVSSSWTTRSPTPPQATRRRRRRPHGGHPKRWQPGGCEELRVHEMRAWSLSLPSRSGVVSVSVVVRPGGRFGAVAAGGPGGLRHTVRARGAAARAR